MTAVYYTEQRLENELEHGLRLADFQANRYVSPMDYMAIASIPGPVGAMTLPAQGPFSTPAMFDEDPVGDVSKKKKDPSKKKRDDGLLSSPIIFIGIGGIILYYLFVPRA